MYSAEQYNLFLQNRNAAKGAGKGNPTHTRIGTKKGDPPPSIPGGSYHILPEDLPQFHRLYCDRVFRTSKREYLTERQLKEGGPLLFDFDFRYDLEYKDRQHTNAQVTHILFCILAELALIYDFQPDDSFKVYVCEREKPYEKEGQIKDGVHILIAIKSSVAIQTYLRHMLLKSLPSFLERSEQELTHQLNNWENVIDKTIATGSTNWQMYGSRKPNCNPYRLTRVVGCSAYENEDYMTDDDDEEAEENERTPKVKLCMPDEKFKETDFHTLPNFSQLSIHHTDHPAFPFKASFTKSYATWQERQKNPPNHKRAHGGETKDDNEDQEEEGDPFVDPSSSTFKYAKTNRFATMNFIETLAKWIQEVVDAPSLKKAVDELFSHFTKAEEGLRELHDLTLILPAKYFQPGSHELNYKVAFALHNTSPFLFLTWVKLRSQSEDFDFETVPELGRRWASFKETNASNTSITKRSIIFWAKEENYTEFRRIRKKYMSFWLDNAVIVGNDHAVASLIQKMYQYEFLCSDLKTHQWYYFYEHRWEQDTSDTLYLKMATDVVDTLEELYTENMKLQSQEANTTSDKYKKLVIFIAKIRALMNDLGNVKPTKNYMIFAERLLHDKEFERNTNANPYLLGCKNGVLDFEQGRFRPGQCSDMITFTTGIVYKSREEYVPENWTKYTNEIHDFFDKIYPIVEMRSYVWEWMASLLIGVNSNQVFTVCYGGGANGKSMVMTLLSVMLNEDFDGYKAILPVAFLTTGRAKVGQTQDEILLLRGKRLAVSEELSKNIRLNEGIMKEVTGGCGANLLIRGIYARPVKFPVTFQCVVCTNNKAEVDSNDDGTWRRIKLLKHHSKFVDNLNDPDYLEPVDENNPQQPRVRKANHFLKDKDIHERFPVWAPYLLTLLAEIAFQTKGKVTECPIINEDTKVYRGEQDIVGTYLRERVEAVPKADVAANKKPLGKSTISGDFKDWCSNEGGCDKKIKISEIYDAITTLYGKPVVGKGWTGLRLKERETPNNQHDHHQENHHQENHHQENHHQENHHQENPRHPAAEKETMDLGNRDDPCYAHANRF